LSFQSLLVTL